VSVSGAKPVGFVLAGGASRRFGRDKALVPWGQGTLLAHALARLMAVCERVEVLCGSDPRYEGCGARTRTDVVAGAGPLGGLLTGVEAAAGAPALFLPVDMPLLPVGLMGALVERLPGHDAVVPVTARGPEPVCGLYAHSCAAAMREAIGQGRLHATAFWDKVRVRTFGLDETQRWGDALALFANVNTPADLEVLLT